MLAQHYPKMYQVEKLCAKLSRRVDLMIANSHCGFKDYQAIFNCRHGVVIPNGLDTAAFYYDDALSQQLRNGISLDGFIIGTVARLTPIKRIESLLYAVRELNQKKVNVSLMIVGYGREQYVNKLKALSKTLNIEHFVYWGETFIDSLP